MPEPLDVHVVTVAQALSEGRVIPFLGAGANLVDRGDEVWHEGADFLPNGSELARYLAERGLYPPLPEGPLPKELNLLRVAEYVAAAGDEADLYLYLRKVFDLEYAPTSLHHLLARAARALKEAGRRLPADRDDELRRPARACVRAANGLVRRRLVRGRRRGGARPLLPPVARRKTVAIEQPNSTPLRSTSSGRRS